MIKKFGFIIAILYGIIVGFTTNVQAMENNVHEKIIAIVNERIITNTELEKRLQFERVTHGLSTDKATSQAVREYLINKMIDEILMKEYAKSLGITVGYVDVQNALQTIAQINKTDVKAIIEDVESKGISRADYEESLNMRLIFERLVTGLIEPKVHVTDQDVSYHTSMISQDERFQPQTEIRLAEIAIADDDNAADMVKVIRTQVAEGKAFTELASSLSNSATRINAGELGWIMQNHLSSQIAKVVSGLEVGEISQPVKIDNDLHIYFIMDKKLSRDSVANKLSDKDLEQFKAMLHRKKLDVEYKKLLYRLKQNAFIEIKEE
jgi:peptidyl-prolyl cis-trans isomerase SurA